MRISGAGGYGLKEPESPRWTSPTIIANNLAQNSEFGELGEWSMGFQGFLGSPPP